MKLTFLGASSLLGNGFSSNMYLESDHANVLIDAGMDIKHSLSDLDIPVEKIKSIYISHAHSDHISGLEYLGFYFRFILKKKPELIINASLVDVVWNIFKYSMQSIGEDQPATLDSYFVVRPVADHKVFMVGDIHFTPIKNKHIFDKNGDIFSYGLVIDRSYSYEYQKNGGGEKTIYISTDTINAFTSEKWPAYIREKVENVDVIFHDCEFSDVRSLNAAHVHYDELKKLPSKIKRKMYLYHYDSRYVDWYNPVWEDDGFAGVVTGGQVFEYCGEKSETIKR